MISPDAKHCICERGILTKEATMNTGLYLVTALGMVLGIAYWRLVAAGLLAFLLLALVVGVVDIVHAVSRA
jgi:hypothetical protein